eukprot:2828488-Amphidinium_carterae.1
MKELYIIRSRNVLQQWITTSTIPPNAYENGIDKKHGHYNFHKRICDWPLYEPPPTGPTQPSGLRVVRTTQRATTTTFLLGDHPHNNGKSTRSYRILKKGHEIEEPTSFYERLWTTNTRSTATDNRGRHHMRSTLAATWNYERLSSKRMPMLSRVVTWWSLFCGRSSVMQVQSPQHSCWGSEASCGVLSDTESEYSVPRIPVRGRFVGTLSPDKAVVSRNDVCGLIAVAFCISGEVQPLSVLV